MCHYVGVLEVLFLGFQGSKQPILKAGRIPKPPLILSYSSQLSSAAPLLKAPRAGPHAEPKAPTAQDWQSSAA
ncbi:hypothetical protein A7K93_04805 [Candidatus Methylacidiphilum fumarolicum]|nr:hypothetical protein A7K72_10425 [Candidatus Methylacidiphilum fumarolicum]TFE74092.1 hypothetical protein A7K93_04805 [Candidatus Methylacidiphilum fumarolicum]TFE76685.1 hypothetical protein A7D33_08600 [Candidatus Methylacidiphilum fumarolicum]